MAKCSARVQLGNNATSEMYNKLHTAMAARGFSRTIHTGRGYVQLPHAEYVTESYASADAAANAARGVAASVDPSYKVFVTLFVEWQGYGLDPAA